MFIDKDHVDQLVQSIRTLHQTTIDQRARDLNTHLTDFFQSIDQDTSPLSKIFVLLTDLLRDYDDRAALKIEFLQGQCLETIDRLLKNPTNTPEDIAAMLRFTAELLVNSENVQQKFLDFQGYEKIFRSIDRIPSPSTQFITDLLLLMTDKSTLQVDASSTSVDLFVHLVNPQMAMLLIRWIPYLNDVSHQHQIIHSIQIIVSRSVQNKMMACSHGIITALIDILREDSTTKKLEDRIVLDTIFSILEKLTRFSISAEDIRSICQLFLHKTSFSKQFLRVLITAAKHDDSDTQAISSYFDLQRRNSGIILPIIRRWPSLTLHFTFHCWLRLNHEADSYPYNTRRQIYSFYSDTMGLEAFICNSSIYIAVSDRRDLVYIELSECDDLIDGGWHSLTIVHTAQRPSLLVAAFQSISTCHLAVYIDGLLRKQIKDFKYVPLTNEPISLASIGAPSQRPRSVLTSSKSDSLHLSSTLAKTIQPFKGLFASRTKTSVSRQEQQALNPQTLVTVEPNSQDTLFGESTCLHGQLACVWVLAETLTDVQVKHLHSMGADFCHQQSPITPDETSPSFVLFDYLSTRSLLVYHPLACNGQVCVDISACTSQMNGRLNNGSCLRLRSFSQSLLNLGGCPVLYPLIDVFHESDYAESSSIDPLSSPTQAETTPDWIIVRKQSQMHLSDIDNRLISNPVASVLNLLRCVLSSTSMVILAEQMTKQYNVELLAQHLDRLSPFFIDQQLLIAIQQLIECSRFLETSNLLTNQLIQHILLDFSLWSKAKFHVRIAHLQYVASVIKDEKKYYRTKFGVQFFLDLLRPYFK